MAMQTNYLKQVNQFDESYQLCYHAWGNPEASAAILCLHGLNRNGRDFDYLASHLAERGYYVVAPDLPGRGNSSYLQDARGYSLEASAADIVALIQALNLPVTALIGTSFGGVISLMLASSNQVALRCLVLNDIGAEVELAGLQRIAKYSVEQPQFATYSEAAKYLGGLCQDDGITDSRVWQEMLLNSLQLNANRRWEIKRDLRLAEGLLPSLPGEGNLQLWGLWHKITLPGLILRGERSDILSATTLGKMCQTNLKAQAMEIPGAGHAPYLYQQSVLTSIGQFIDRHH
jgi:pimeloyl-ACP methyl ester carboxylesterase